MKAWFTREDDVIGKVDTKLLIRLRDVLRESRSSIKERYSAEAPRQSLRAIAMW
jgi:hypothetical protein